MTSKQFACTYCGGLKFYEGPSGGGAINILCANLDCRHWFNDTGFEIDDLHKIEPTQEERQIAQEREKARQQARREEIYREGYNLFKAGKSAMATLQDPPLGMYAAPRAEDIARQADILKLAGWLDALNAHYGGRYNAKRRK